MTLYTLLVLTTAVLAVIVARSAQRLRVFVDVTQLPAFAPASRCHVVGDTAKTAPAAEDLRFVAPSLVLASSGYYGDLRKDDAAPPGALVLVDLVTERSRALEMDGFPTDVGFYPHGIEVHERSSPPRVFVVNHATREERVDVFELENGASYDAAKLKWVGAVSLPIPRLAANSVAAVSADEFYVTQWLPAAVPPGGTERNKLATQRVFAELLGIRIVDPPPFVAGRTAVYRCSLAKKQCALAYGRFLSANGIDASPDGRFLFVVDCARDELSVMRRDLATGALSLVKTHRYKYGIDNVAVRALPDGKLQLQTGNIPSLWKFILESVTHTTPIPGALLVAEFDPAQPDAELRFVDELEVVHDGTLVSGISAGLVWWSAAERGEPGPLAVLGGHKRGGVLVCPVGGSSARGF